MRHWMFVIGVLFVVSSLLAGCAAPTPAAKPTDVAPSVAATKPAAAPAATAPAAPASAPTQAVPKAKIKRGGTFIIGYGEDTTTHDPAFTPNSNLLAMTPHLEALLLYDQPDQKTGKAEIKPELAESYQVVDPKTIVLKLRKDVKFHDGSDFNAEAAKWQLDRTRTNPKSLGRSYLEPIDSIDTPDPYTLKLNMKSPAATIFICLTRSAGGSGSNGTYMISKAAFDKLGEEAIGRKPYSTGPFYLDEWVRDSKTVYKKWDQYWKKGDDGQALPYLDRFETRVILDKAVAVLEVRTNNIQGFWGVEVKDFAAVKSSPDTQLVLMPFGAGPLMVGFNQEKNPFGKNLKLRQAAQYATDRDAIVKTIGMGQTIPDPYHVWISSYPGYDETLPQYKFDLEKAKALIKESGVTTPIEADMFINGTVGTSTQKTGEMLKSMWDKIGINVILNPADSATFKSATKRGEWSTDLFGMVRSPDPDMWSRMYTCDGGANFSNYCNPEMDKCMEQGRKTYDLKERDTIYKKCQKILYDDALIFGVHNTPGNVVLRKEVMGLKIAGWHPEVRELWLDK
jgi:peptide/nickel transport system substrate-binding protein